MLYVHLAADTKPDTENNFLFWGTPSSPYEGSMKVKDAAQWRDRETGKEHRV